MIAGRTESDCILCSCRAVYSGKYRRGKANGRIKELSKHSPNLEFEKMKAYPAEITHGQAREIAGERVKYMAEFFDRLRSEIVGER